MAISPHGLKSIEKLIEAGLIPQECTKFEVMVAVGQPVRIRSEAFVTKEQMDALVAALTESPEAAREYARQACFMPRYSHRLSPAVTVEFPPLQIDTKAPLA